MAHIDKPTVICPHCDHEYDSEDMYTASEDLFALAPNEDIADIQCAICDNHFVVKGGYKPLYSTAFASEELD